MDKIIANLNDGTWWFTVIVMALIVSISAKYLSVWIDKIWSAFSVNHRQAKAKKEIKTSHLLEKIASDQDLLTLKLIVLAIDWLKTIFYGLFVILLSLMLFNSIYSKYSMIINFIIFFMAIISFLSIARYTSKQDRFILNAYNTFRDNNIKSN